MSSQEQIFLHTSLSPAQAAQQLAAAIGGAVDQDENGEVYVTRPLSDGQGKVGGQLSANTYGEENPESGEDSLYDGYDTVYEIWASTQDEDRQRAEALDLFNDITSRLPWPAALTHDFGELIAAHAPHLGRTEFLPHTTPDAQDRAIWDTYARPAASDT